MKSRLIRTVVLGMVLSTAMFATVSAAEKTSDENTESSAFEAAIMANEELSVQTVTGGAAFATDTATASGQNSIAIGMSATASQPETIAIGSSTQATKWGAVAMGLSAKATGNYATAIGWQASSSNLYSIAIGTRATASRMQSVAIGSFVNATGIGSIAIGQGVQNEGTLGALATDSIAIGTYATANQVGAVAIGSNAVAGRAGAVGATYTLGGENYTFAGTSSNDTTVGVVSFGGTTNGVTTIRQLQYVAAGQVSATSTDAINGSQLYAAYSAIDALDTRVSSLEGKSYVEKVEPNEDGLTFTQVTGKGDTASGGADGSDATDPGTSNQTTTTLIYTDKHISGLEQSFDNTTGKLTTSITTNEQDNGKKYEFTVDVSEYVTEKVKTEAGQGTITVGTQETTIEKAINDNTERINTIETSIADNTARIASIDSRMNKVGAGAAALASLHPLDYDRDNKFAMSAGIGNYAGTQAGAVGAFYRPNEDIMLSMASTFGNGADMVNFGVTFAIGSGKSPYASMSKKDLVHKVDQMSAEIEELKAIVAELAAKK